LLLSIRCCRCGRHWWLWKVFRWLSSSSCSTSIVVVVLQSPFEPLAHCQRKMRQNVYRNRRISQSTRFFFSDSVSQSVSQSLQPVRIKAKWVLDRESESESEKCCCGRIVQRDGDEKWHARDWKCSTPITRGDTKDALRLLFR
jgi:hypothetical protein